MDGYSTAPVLEQREMNASLRLKGSDHLRLDAMVEVSAKSMIDVLLAQEKFE